MDKRRVGFAVVAILFVGFAAGCKKSETRSEPTPGAQSVPPAPVAQTVARIHWLGKERLADTTNAARFMDIWKLPESARLEAQTLEKLSLAPWRLLKGDAATNGAPTALLRPLLDDLVRAESYLEVRHATNQPGELAFAIRLSAERAGLWETNLAAVFESLTGLRASRTNGGWWLKKHDLPNFVELARAGEWTVVGLAQDRNALFTSMLNRVQRDPSPFGGAATNFWLTLDLDLLRVAQAFALNWQLPPSLPRISVSMTGDGTNVRTRGELSFHGSLGLDLEPWNIPTNFIHEPLVSFTAIRGIKPQIGSLKAWQQLGVGDPPNQFFCWGRQGFPLQTYFSAPLLDASNRVQRVAEAALQSGNPWLATNGMVQAERSPRGDAVEWKAGPFMSLHLQSQATEQGDFILGGLVSPPNFATNSPPPAELIQAILGITNLICYEWELTQSRLGSWIYLGQALRLVFFKAQLPPTSASIAWFGAAAASLGNSTMLVTQSSPEQLSFVRQSSVGFTALELHLLADWLECPQFPRGLHSFVVPPDRLTTRRPSSPAVPPQH